MIQRFRASWVSLAVWILLLIFVLSPFIVILPVLIIGNTNTGTDVGFGLWAFILLFTTLRYILLRVEIGPDYIEKSGIFGTKRIALTADIRCRYNLSITKIAPHSVAGALTAVVAERLSDPSKTNYTIFVRDDSQTMRLTSSIKDIHKIAEFLQHFELSVILPSLRQKIEWGQQVDSGAISQDAAHIYCGRTVIEKPLKTPPSITKGIMTLYFQTPDGKARKCKATWRDIWNPFATCELFTKAQNRGPQRFNTDIATVYYPG